MIISQILFLILLVWVFKEAVKRYGKVIRNIRLGRNDEPLNNKGGFRRMLLVAFGQQKMFKRPLPAILHLFIYVAFIITQFDLLEQIIDGITGSHRILSHYLGGLYSFMISFIELLSVFAFIATSLFVKAQFARSLPPSRDLAGWAK